MIVKEHSTRIEAELPKTVSAEMEVFYNPIMASNRNISVLLLNSLPNKNMNIADPLAGSGIRSLRFLQELKKGKLQALFVNDVKENFLETFQNNQQLNPTGAHQISVKNEDASMFLLHQNGFDYIDIDPFGSPNPFLAAALARISRDGILAVTATDTAALTGTYPKATNRKYWATSQKNYMMHETGLRILIRKIQLQAMQFEKALIPILAYHKDHYFRIYFVADRSKELCDEIFAQHQYLLFCPACLNYKVSKYNYAHCQCNHQFQFAGPLWAGKIIDEKLIKTMVKENPFPEEQKFLELLKEEASMPTVGFYDLHALARCYKAEPPRSELALKELNGVRTIFSPTGIKTKKEFSQVVKLFKSKP